MSFSEGPSLGEVSSSWFVGGGGGEAALNHRSLNMKVFHTFFCFLFIAQQDGNTEFVSEENKLFRRLEGENITVSCPFSVFGRRNLFCRETCEEGNILIETTENNHQRGRFSIKYEDRPFPSDNFLHVTIKQLKNSDSGRYRCALEKLSFLHSFQDFQIVVIGASTTSQPKSTLPTFPPSTFLPSTSTATTPTEQSLSSTSGRSEPPSTSTESPQRSASTTSQPKSTLPTFPPSTFLPSTSTAKTPTEQSLSSTSGRSEPPSTSTESSQQLNSSPQRSDLHLYMGLILVVLIFILSKPLMIWIFCKKRRSTKPKAPPVEMNHINVSESSRVIEEIMEDRQISSPPVETSSPLL